jgi:hypothetical protein
LTKIRVVLILGDMVNYILSVTMATIGICSAKIKTTGMKEGIDEVQKFRF